MKEFPGLFVNYKFISMPRQDIAVDPVYGELHTTDNLTNKTIYDFTLLDAVTGADNDRYRYAEVTVPAGFGVRYKDANGIRVYVPYLPEFKELQVCFRQDNPNGEAEYLINKTDNRIWFPVFREDEQGEKMNIRLSEFRVLNENCYFNLIIRDGHLALFSGNESDMQIKAAMRQNEVFLLKASAGNLYQYPSSGVGLIDFLHGNFENTGLAAKLQSEFEGDKMIINNAYMDSVTGELYLDAIEKENG